MPAAPSASSPRPAIIATTADGYNEVLCSDLLAARPTVFLAFGQSIASNFNQTPHTPINKVYSIDRSHCFEARDPMPGADGSLGSMWSWLGDALPEKDFPFTAFVTIGVGGSSIAQWDVNGGLNARLTSAVEASRRAGFEFSYLLWHQGSADRGMPPEVYQSHFRSMIQSLAPYGLVQGNAAGQTRVLVAIHSRCGDEADPAIAAAQQGLFDPPTGVFPGAETDSIDSSLRFDGCHLSTMGQSVAAHLWRQRIEAARDYTLPH